MQRAAFLDRDGVINIDHAYVHRWDEFEFIDGVLKAAKRLFDAGYQLIIVTNQSGIGRGYYTEADFRALDAKVREAFEKAGAPITDVYFCPHHPKDALPQYRIECNCRKPAPGMMLQAAKDHDIDLSQSVMFGDKSSDMKAALAAGIPTRILLGTDGKETPKVIEEATFVARDLACGVELLLSRPVF